MSLISFVILTMFSLISFNAFSIFSIRPLTEEESLLKTKYKNTYSTFFPIDGSEVEILVIKKPTRIEILVIQNKKTVIIKYFLELNPIISEDLILADDLWLIIYPFLESEISCAHRPDDISESLWSDTLILTGKIKNNFYEEIMNLKYNPTFTTLKMRLMLIKLPLYLMVKDPDSKRKALAFSAAMRNFLTIISPSDSNLRIAREEKLETDISALSALTALPPPPTFLDSFDDLEPHLFEDLLKKPSLGAGTNVLRK